MEVFTAKQDLGNIDIFKELYEFAENQKLQDANGLTIIRFKEVTEALENQSRNFIGESNKNIARITHSYLETSLKVFLFVLKRGGMLHRPVLSAYFRYLSFLGLVLNIETSTNNDLFFARNFTVNFPSLFGPKAGYNSNYLKNHLNYGVPIELLEKKPFYYEIDFKDLERNIEYEFNLLDKTYSSYDKEMEMINIFHKDFLVQQFVFNPNTDNLIFQNDYYEYIIDISLENHEKDAQMMASALFKILSSISSVENVSTQFEHLELGSILARIRVKMKDFVAKNEVRNFFILLRELLFGVLTNGKTSAVETLKKIAEIDKLDAERKLIRKRLVEENNEDEVMKHRLLEIERKQLENRKLDIQNTAAQLANLKTVVELAKDGILEADLTKVDLNGISFINTHGEKIVDSDEDIDKMT